LTENALGYILGGFFSKPHLVTLSTTDVSYRKAVHPPQHLKLKLKSDGLNASQNLLRSPLHSADYFGLLQTKPAKKAFTEFSCLTLPLPLIVSLKWTDFE
jgi:hypothetical protein